MDRFLKLKDRAPLNMGHSRMIFQHPDDPSLVVKVIRPDVVEKRFGSGTAWYKRRRRYGRFVSYVREIQEYIAVHSACGGNLPFLQKVIGLVETDMGLGLVTEAARDSEGNLAPNIAMLIESGRFDSAVRGKLETLIQQVLDCPVVIGDMNVGNLVYASTGSGDHFVVIDGMGDKNILPLKTLSGAISRRSKIKRFERLYIRIEERLKKAGHPMPPLPQP